MSSPPELSYTLWTGERAWLTDLVPDPAHAHTPESGGKGVLEGWLVVPMPLLPGMTPVQDSFMSTSLLLHWLRISATVPITYHGKLGLR